MNCEFCSKPTHVWFQCPSKPDGWKPARLVKKSTAARKDVPENAGLDNSTVRVGGSVLGSTPKLPASEATAGTQALPVDTNPGEGSCFDVPTLSFGPAPDRRARDKDDQLIPHPAFQCRKKSTAPSESRSRRSRSANESLPVDTNSEHRENEGFGAFTSHNVSTTTSAGTVGNEDRQPIPKPKFDRVSYQREYMRKRRAEQREYRERKKSEHQ